MKTFITLFLSLFTALSSMQQPKEERMKNKINTLFAEHKGIFALAFSEVGQPKKSLFINAEEMFHAASTMKTPVMVEAFKQHYAGSLNLNDPLKVKNSFFSIVDSSLYSMDIGRDSGDKLYAHIGKNQSIKALVTDMIIHSSNLATNLVIELLDGKKITETMRSLGAETIQVLRGVEDMKAYRAGLNNQTSAMDLHNIFMAIANGNAVNPQASKEMIAILEQQTHGEIIPAGLPKGVRVAHKTGSISGVRHDSGMVITASGKKYVLILLSKELKEPQKAIKMMARVSKIIFEYVEK